MTRGLHTAGNLLYGAMCSLPAVLLSVFLFGAGTGLKAVIAFSVTVIATAFPLLFGGRRDRHIRRISAVCAFPLLAVLLLRAGLYGASFAAAHRDYVREFGGPNAGDGLGLFVIDLPVALIALLCGMLLAKHLTGDLREE